MNKKYIIVFVFVVIVTLFISYFIISKPAEELDQPSLDNKRGEVSAKDFNGEKGEKVNLLNGQVELDVSVFDDELVHYYNVKVGAKTVYFFVVKDKNGVLRAAANACQVCFGSMMGFSRQGDYMVCNTCGNKYPLEKIATEKGGCNPGPINPNLEVVDGKVFIKESELKEVSGLF